MRSLNIGDIAVPLTDEAAAQLVAAGLVYDCDLDVHGHDLHLMPDEIFDLEDVERLALAIHRSAARSLDA